MKLFSQIRIKSLFLLITLMLNFSLMSQAPSCPTQSIYAHNGAIINGHTLPNGPATTVLNNLPGGAGGLAVGPAFGFPAPNPTWWTTAGNPRTYWYYNNGGTWTNTNHQVGNNAAVNIGGGGGAIYNLVGGTGQIYKYIGTGNGFFLNTLVPAFSGQGPYDIVCDMADNFFILKASPAAQQGIYCYNPSGVLTCSWSITGMINQTAGGGFSILTTTNPAVHKMYYNSNGTDYIGNMLPGITTIASTVQPLPGGGDYASCALPIPTGTIVAPLGGTLTCNLPQIPLVAQVLGNASLNWIGGYNTPTTTPVTPTCGAITWSGPGIVSGQGTPTINVNVPGVYSYTLNGCNTCPGYSITASFTVVGLPGVISPIITAPLCFTGQSTMSVSPNTNTNTVVWSGPGIVGPNNTYTISFNQPGVYTTTITGGACSGTASILVNPTPTINIIASTNSLCQQSFNGSQTIITFTGTGAPNYTWTSVGLNTTQANTVNPITYTSNIISTIGSVTLVGTNGTCSNSATYSINITPNPTIAVSSASMCSGSNVTLTANGASTYTWLPNINLNTNNGPSVISNPSITTTYSIVGTNAGCNSQTQTSTVTVVNNPIVTITPTNPVICLGNNINLIAAGATNYTWSPNIALSTTLGAVVNASPTTNQTYTVIGEASTCTNIASITVTVLPLPIVSVVASSPSICANNFNGSPDVVTLTGLGASNYTWTSITGLTTNTLNGSIVSATAGIGSTGTGVLIGANGTCTNSTTFTINIIPNPTISVTSGSMCIGTNVTLSASGANTFTWSPSNTLNTNIGSSVIANPNTNTVYSVIGNSLGCNSQTQTGTVTVVSLPVITIGPITNTICAGSNITLIANGATNYTWVPNTNLNVNVGPSVIANPPSTTNYTVIGEAATCTNSAVYQVSVIPVPIIQLSVPSETICQYQQVIITANGASNYYWTPTNSTGNSIIVTPNTTTTYSVVGSNGVCIGSASITINVVPYPNVNIFTPKHTICNGDNTSITASGATYYIWTPSTNLSSSSSAVVIANPSLSINYMVTGYNSLGTVSCGSTKGVSITVIPQTSVVVSNSVAICIGSAAMLQAEGGSEYNWTPFDVPTNGPNVYVTPTITTQYSVVATNQDNCPSTAGVLVVVNPLPVVNAGPDLTYNLDEAMYINATGTGTLTWIYGEGITCKPCPNTQVFPLFSGYYITEAVNQYGCKAQDQLYITVTKNHNVWIPNTFTPNFDGINDVFYVYGTGIVKLELSIFDRWGEQIFSTNDQLKGWDGTYKGLLCKDDVYVYKLTYTALDGKAHTKTGHVTLLK